MCLTRLDFYPRSPCGERPNNLHISEKWARISIHALLAESDGDGFVYCDTDSVFLSTLSLRRATLPLARPGPCLCDFYPRSPCGERRKINGCVSLYSTFLSTLSLRRATGGYKALGFDTLISIHALLAESDGWPSRPSCGPCGYFYPRSPCGERLRLLTLMLLPCIFLSTLSLRRATLAARDGLTNAIFLSTLSLRRATGYPGGKACAGLFLSTLSLRRATLAISAHCFDGRISIHALLAESDVAALGGHGHPRISIHALLAESDSSRCGISARWTNFYPRSPCGERPNP